MDVRPSLLPDTRQVLKLARKDKRAAERTVAALSLDDQVALVCSAAPSRRSALLELTPEPEAVIPRMPEAELCFTVKAVGLWDASWILEHATPEQLVASLDLDGWQGVAPDTVSLREWLSALAHAGSETLLRAARSLDPELVVLLLRDRVQVMLDPKDDEWQPPEGSRTLEGQFHLLPHRDGDDIADLLALLHAVFQEDYWLYFRIMQGVIWELESDLEEWALRWRTGRLEDLGFPCWEEAMKIYGYVRPADRAAMPDAGDPLEVAEWQLPVFISDLPAARDSRFSVFRAAAELRDDERRGFFYAFVAMANRLAIADRMPLGNADTLPEAVEAVASVVSTGLEWIAKENGLGLADALRRVTLERLFRVGASLEGRKPPPTPDREDQRDELEDQN